MIFEPLIERVDADTFRIVLDTDERDAVIGSCDAVREILTEDPQAPIAWRLFPIAYEDDEDQQRFFEQMTRDELLASRMKALETVSQTAGAEVVSLAHLEQWMTAINSTRLMLGTALGITDESEPPGLDDPDMGMWATYELLTILLGSIVHVLSPG